jgi:hypothetical protein
MSSMDVSALSSAAWARASAAATSETDAGGGEPPSLPLVLGLAALEASWARESAEPEPGLPSADAGVSERMCVFVCR